MALLSIPASQPEAKEETYQNDYLVYKGYVDRIPILNSILVAKAAAVTASWRTYGKDAMKAADWLDAVNGNGKQTFKMLMHNANIVATTGGDAFVEITGDNLVMLPPDNIEISMKNGVITKYKEITGEGEWKPDEILHFAYSPMGASVHGRSLVENMTEVLRDYAQLMDTGMKIAEVYSQPTRIFELDTDDDDEIEKWKTEVAKYNDISAHDIVVPKGLVTVKISQVSAGGISPQPWLKMLAENMLMSCRVSENILGIGTQNSEESARMQMAGFTQSVRFEQKWMEDSIRFQLFRKLGFDAKMKFSYAAEAQDEKYNRMLQAFGTVNGFQIPQGIPQAAALSLANLKVLTQIKILKEAGVIEE